MQYRLPKSIEPLSYNINLRPDLSLLKFDGIARTKLLILEPTDKIFLNALNLTINQAALILNEDDLTIWRPILIDIQRDSELLCLHFEKDIPIENKPILQINFSGIIDSNLSGFYYSKYQNEKNETCIVAVTQFAPTDARRAFPCWDEPSFKATFTLSIEALNDDQICSNMSIEKETILNDDMKVVEFLTTPLMSTYLLSWTVGHFDILESIYSNSSTSVPIRILVPKGLSLDHAQFALDVSKKFLQFFVEYFDISYPLPKLDMVGIPDFAFGAMENWGMITFRLSTLLFDPSNSSKKTVQKVAYVIAHEIAHQWFGNLVTMDWWTGLWLNEGFATWMAWKAVNNFFLDWNIWTLFIHDEIHLALSFDGLASSHPVEVPINEPSEISQIFDPISYSKGASIIRMLEGVVGPSLFTKNIRKYLKKHSYTNASTSDLWSAMDISADVSVPKMMSMWTKQTGYPVVSVTAVNRPDGVTRWKFVQKKFSYDYKETDSPDENRSIWHIPMHLASVNSTGNFESLLILEEEEVIFDPPSFVKLIIPNSGRTGFFRVNYSPDLRKEILEVISKNLISGEDKLSIINDTFHLGLGGYISATEVLELWKLSVKDLNRFIWSEICMQINYIQLSLFEKFSEKNLDSKWGRFICLLFNPLLRSLGWVTGTIDTINEIMLRSLCIKMLGLAGDEEVIRRCRVIFAEYMNNNHQKIVSMDLLEAILCIAIHSGGIDEYELVWELYRNSRTVDLKLTALVALTFSQSAPLIQRNLDLILSNDIRSQDLALFCDSLGSQESCSKSLWLFFQSKWDILYDRFYAGSIQVLLKMIPACIKYLNSIEEYENAINFFKSRKQDLSSLSKCIQQSLERINITIQWKNRDQENMLNWLRALKI